MIIYVVNCTIAIQISPEMNARIDQKMTQDANDDIPCKHDGKGWDY